MVIELVALFVAAGLVAAADLLVTRWRKKVRLQEKDKTE
jgi:hypothetical protein